jgi:mannose-6-phosphate isomerase-like protein (cupin superfamily)
MLLSEVVVRKPWGHEYLCYRNEVLAIWFLHIEFGKKTSLHCHPNKHTGFVILDGTVKLRFLRGEVQLTGLDKIHIFRARFHSTEALSDNGAYILEVETPEDKHDLVRLEDAYGRKGQQYEGAEHHTLKSDDAIWIPEPGNKPNAITNVHGCVVDHISVHKSGELLGYSEHDIFIILRGGLAAGKQAQILWPGDVVDGLSLNRLANAFVVIPNTTLLHITKPNQLLLQSNC